MPHQRKRYLEKNIIKTLGFSPIIGILGHRQVGKTTLLTKLSHEYCTLDDEATLDEAQKHSKDFLNKFKRTPVGIDECQLAPRLFSALKENVRVNKKPGRFILSGSVRFTSRAAIRESLTGRIINFDLLPFSISELHHFDLSQICPKIMGINNLELAEAQFSNVISSSKITNNHIDHYLKTGGLPGICFIKNEKIRNIKIQEQLQTILDRDIRLVYPTNLPYTQILDYFKELSNTQGIPIRYSYFEKKVKISEATQKKLLNALEAIFLIRRLPIEGDRIGHVIFLEDQAESFFLSEKNNHQQSYEGLLYRNIRTQFNYSLGLAHREFHYLSRGGARVPFAIQTDLGRLGFILIEGDTPNRSELAISSSFLKKYSNSKIIFATQNNSFKVINERTLLIPTRSLL